MYSSRLVLASAYPVSFMLCLLATCSAGLLASWTASQLSCRPAGQLSSCQIMDGNNYVERYMIGILSSLTGNGVKPGLQAIFARGGFYTVERDVLAVVAAERESIQILFQQVLDMCKERTHKLVERCTMTENFQHSIKQQLSKATQTPEFEVGSSTGWERISRGSNTCQFWRLLAPVSCIAPSGFRCHRVTMISNRWWSEPL